MTPPRLAEVLRARPALTALFVDFDGTLAPIVTEPGAARPVPGAVEALAVLAPRYARVAVLSGRPLAYLRPFVPLGIDIAGLYGLECRVDGQTTDRPEAAAWRPVVDAAVDDAGRGPGATTGAMVEHKGLSMTIHFRRAPHAETAVWAWADACAARTGLVARGAKASVELHPPLPVDKGSVLREWAVGAQVVAYFGDDLGDLAAFAAVEQLVQTGALDVGVAVAVAGAETPRALLDRADAVLDGPAAVAALFQALAAVN